MKKPRKKKEWSYEVYLKSAIRKIWRWSPSRKQVLAEATGCKSCRKLAREYNADHVTPVVPIVGWDSWDNYIGRMFHGELQALCEKCHKKKTKEENAARREAKKEKGVNGA